MVDTLVSGASASRRVGSTPIMGTIRKQRKNLWIFPLFSLDRFANQKCQLYQEKRQTLISEDLSNVAPELGLEPRTL